MNSDHVLDSGERLFCVLKIILLASLKCVAGHTRHFFLVMEDTSYL